MSAARFIHLTERGLPIIRPTTPETIQIALVSSLFTLWFNSHHRRSGNSGLGDPKPLPPTQCIPASPSEPINHTSTNSCGPTFAPTDTGLVSIK